MRAVDVMGRLRHAGVDAYAGNARSVPRRTYRPHDGRAAEHSAKAARGNPVLDGTNGIAKACAKADVAGETEA